MSRWLVCLVVLLLVLLVCPTGAQQYTWIPVVLHGGHSDFSDGEFTIGQNAATAKALGARAFSTSDHAEMIEAPFGQLDLATQLQGLGYSVSGNNTKKVGINNWFADVLAVQARSGLIVLYGVEVGCGKDRHCHIGFYSTEPTVIRSAIAISQEEGVDREENIPRTLSELRLHGNTNCFIVANHPTSKSYWFPTEHLWRVDAVEIFNHMGDSLTDNPSTAMARAVAAGKSIISGADYHGDVVEKAYRGAHADGLLDFFPQLRRYTMVGVQQLSAQGVLDGLRAGRCYAAFGDARITSGPMPGDTINPDQAPRIVTGLQGLDTKFASKVMAYFYEQGSTRKAFAAAEVGDSKISVAYNLRELIRPWEGNGGTRVGILAPGVAFNALFVERFTDTHDSRLDFVPPATKPVFPSYAPTPLPQPTPPPQPQVAPQEEEQNGWDALINFLAFRLFAGGGLFGAGGQQQGGGRVPPANTGNGGGGTAAGPQEPFYIPTN